MFTESCVRVRTTRINQPSSKPLSSHDWTAVVVLILRGGAVLQ